MNHDVNHHMNRPMNRAISSDLPGWSLGISRKLLRKLPRLDHPAWRAGGALAVALALGLIFNPGGAFLRWSTHRDMLRQVSVYGILSCGMTWVVIAGGIDLSVGSVLGLASVLFSMMTLHAGWSAWSALPLTLAAGVACGLVSGTLIARLRVQAFVATLAMMVFARGLAKWLSGGQKISRSIAMPDGSYSYADLPRIFEVLDHKLWGENIAAVTLVFVGCAVFAGVLLARTRLGRYFYAVGGNAEASRLSGVPVRRTQVWAYALCGMFAAIAGICQAVQEQQGDPEAGGGYELTAIAMVVIGGTSLAGGRGKLAFTLLGALTIGYLEKILSINAVGEPLRLMLTGAIVIAAVLLQKKGTVS
jgi:ribose transport system permease protein